MPQENELVTLLMALAVFIFLCSNASRIKCVPRHRLFLAAYSVLLTAWGLTILEGYYWEATVNALEHMCYAGGAILLACWCWAVFVRSPRCQ